jgi:hypothetical protein
MLKGRLIAILLTGVRLIRRAKAPGHMLGDKAYDSAELREQLDKRGTKPVIPNRCNRKQPFSDHQMRVVVTVGIAVGGFLIWAAASYFEAHASCPTPCATQTAR